MLACKFLNKEKWIRKSYKHEAYIGALVSSITAGLPFTVAISVTTLLALRFTPSARSDDGASSIFSIKGMAKISAPGDINGAIDILIAYFSSPHSGISGLLNLHALFSHLCHSEPEAFVELSLETRSKLTDLIQLILKLKNHHLDSLAVLFAQIFPIGRLLPFCCEHVSNLLDSRIRARLDPFLSTSHKNQSLQATNPVSRKSRIRARRPTHLQIAVKEMLPGHRKSEKQNEALSRPLKTLARKKGLSSLGPACGQRSLKIN